ncbi:MAG TPA: acylphosphatase [Chloroflexi bacterium]|nr:acylphosphatase [Chloroflexota bacterium]
MNEQINEQNETSLPKARLHATIHGRVQGVSFRYYTIQTARRLDLTGWVANRWDSAVETVAEGSRDTLKEFLSFLREGSPAAFVQKVDHRWEAATGEFDHFKVRYL